MKILLLKGDTFYLHVKIDTAWYVVSRHGISSVYARSSARPVEALVIACLVVAFVALGSTYV